MQALDAQAGLRVGADGEHLGAGAAGHGQHVWVVGVEHGEAVGRQRLQQAALLLGNGGQRAESGQVRLADGGDYTHLRPRQGCQVANLVETVRCQLQHRNLVLRRQLAGRNRQTVAAVDAAAVVKDRPAAAGQHGGDQLLGRGLAGRSGYSDRGQIWPLQGKGRISQQRGARVRHDDAGDALRLQVYWLLAEHAAGAARHRVEDVIVAIPFFAFDGDENWARPGTAKAGPCSAPPVALSRSASSITCGAHGAAWPAAWPAAWLRRAATRRRPSGETPAERWIPRVGGLAAAGSAGSAPWP